MPNADELRHLLDAKLWSEVHQLLCLRLAPQLFLASYSQDDLGPTAQQQQMESKLQRLLSQLNSHSHELAVSVSRLTHPEADWHVGQSWTEGAGVYSTYYRLRVQLCAIHEPMFPVQVSLIFPLCVCKVMLVTSLPCCRMSLEVLAGLEASSRSSSAWLST